MKNEYCKDKVQLYKGDCLEIMKDIPDKSIDMILCDLPYGTTQNKWDSVIPFDELWREYKRIIKDNGIIVLFSQQPFTSKLICSNLKMFRYELIWEKSKITGFLNAKRMPLRSHENILIFYKKLPIYNPQKWQINERFMDRRKKMTIDNHDYRDRNYGQHIKSSYKDDGTRYPTSVLSFPSENTEKTNHPTQKPTALLEYLIKTYTNENMIVLDNCMGSGSTGIACINTNRGFIGIEKDDKYFDLAYNRINEYIKNGVRRERKLF